MGMEVRKVYVTKLELMVDTELVEDMLDRLSYDDMAEVLNDEKILDSNYETWNTQMVENLDENGRKHIKKLYDLVCEWYEANPEDAEMEGYTEW